MEGSKLVMEKSPDRFGIQKFLFKKSNGIRAQVQRIIFICCIVSFFTVSVIALAGMFTARQNSIEDGSEMGGRAAEITADKLESAERKRISLLGILTGGPGTGKSTLLAAQTAGRPHNSFVRMDKPYA